MSVHHVQALVMGFTQSGKTTLITRWVTGRLPTEHTKTLPFNGAKSINIRSKKHHTKELVVVRFVDGSDASDDDLRRLCCSADVIVACMCVEINGLDEQTIKALNNIFTTRRPPIIVLGTMLDLRYNIQTQSASNTDDTVTDKDHADHTMSEAPEVNVPTGELTVENVTKHRVSFSVSMDNRRAGDPVETGITSDEEQSDVNERIVASITESDGNTDLDMSSINTDIQTSAIRKKDPAYWSTESINGSLVTRLDESHDSWSEINAEDKLLNDVGATFASSVPEEDLTQRLAAAKSRVSNSSTEPETSHLVDRPLTYPKPLIETHFPLNLDIPLTVKHFPKQHKTLVEQRELSFKSKHVIPFKEDDWFSEDEPDDISFREISSRFTDSRAREPVTNTTPRVSDDYHANAAKSETEHTTLSSEDLLSASHMASGYMNTRHLKEGLSLLSASTPPPSVLPEDRNFHVNLDADPVSLSDHDPEQLSMRVNINGYCKEWSIADGLRLAKTVKGDTYMECSACTGQNLQEVFEYIARVGCKYTKKKNEKCSVS